MVAQGRILLSLGTRNMTRSILGSVPFVFLLVALTGCGGNHASSSGPVEAIAFVSDRALDGSDNENTACVFPNPPPSPPSIVHISNIWSIKPGWLGSHATHQISRLVFQRLKKRLP